MKLPVHRPPDDGDDVADEDVIEAIDVSWSEPPPPSSSTESGVQVAVPRISDSTPPGEDTHMTDLHTIARVLDLNAIPRRVRIEMVSFPLPREGWDLLNRIDGRSSLQRLLVESGMSVDEGLPLFQQLLRA